MSLVNKNLAANFLGKSWVVLLSLLFFSTFLRLFGVEAYGLIGFYNALLALLVPLDLGLPTATNREIAKLSAENPTSIPNFVRTLEWIFWISAFCIGALLLGFSSCIATHWLSSDTLPQAVVTRCLAYIAIAILAQWPASFYSAILMGLQKQVFLNLLTISFGTLKVCGALLLFFIIHPSIEIYFLWQITFNFLQTLLMKFFAWKTIRPNRMSVHFDKSHLLRIKQFALGISGVSLTAIVLTHLDKVVLSRLLSLENFGKYSLVTTVASSVTFLSAPLFISHFPHLTQLAARGDALELKKFYHKGAQKLALLTIPASLVVVFFSQEILQILLGAKVEMSALPTLLSLYMLGSLLNALMTMPHALQLAVGWTRLPLYQNFIAIPLLSTSLVWATLRYGAISAAIIWLLLNVGYVSLTVPVMHRRVLRGEMLAWYLKDLGLPFVSTFLGIFACRLLLPTAQNTFSVLMLLSLVFIIGVFCCAMGTETSRFKLRKWMRKSPELLR